MLPLTDLRTMSTLDSAFAVVSDIGEHSSPLMKIARSGGGGRQTRKLCDADHDCAVARHHTCTHIYAI